jgi:hypothetical protein
MPPVPQTSSLPDAELVMDRDKVAFFKFALKIWTEIT